MWWLALNICSSNMSNLGRAARDPKLAVSRTHLC
jgi:hypothetical protein